jgi:hypothetical protein
MRNTPERAQIHRRRGEEGVREVITRRDSPSAIIRQHPKTSSRTRTM